MRNIHGPSKFFLLILPFLVSCTAATFTTGEFSTAAVEVLRIDPEPGTIVDGETKFVATIRYEISDFKSSKGLYLAEINFATTKPGTTFKTQTTNEGRAVLKQAQGEITLFYRLSSLKQREDLRLSDPLQLQFIVTEKSGPKGRSRVIGSTEFPSYH